MLEEYTVVASKITKQFRAVSLVARGGGGGWGLYLSLLEWEEEEECSLVLLSLCCPPSPPPTPRDISCSTGHATGLQNSRISEHQNIRT